MEKPIYKRPWFIIVASNAVLIIFIISLLPSNEEIQKKATADSLQVVKAKAIKAEQDSVANFQKDSADKAFAKLPKKEQERILEERLNAELRSSMQRILDDNEKNFHIKYIAKEFIEKSLKNPDSFEEKETSEPEIIITDKLAGFRVLITYTATNGFGATIQERKFVVVDKTGTKAILALPPQ